MKPVDRQKICPNCDGRIPYDATQCTYCFTALQVENSSSKLFSSPQDSPYTPPYSAPYKGVESSEAKKSPAPAYGEGATAKAEVADNQSFLILLYLTLGGNLFTLGILQFFFSDRGVVRLEINGSYWFLMVLVSLPLLYLGFRSNSK